MQLTRRNFVKTSMAVSTTTALGQTRLMEVFGLNATPLDQLRPIPRERLLLDRNWRFMLGNAADPSKDLNFEGPSDFSKQKSSFSFAHPEFDDSKWRQLDLPHDWAIELPFVHDDYLKGHGYHPVSRKYPLNSVGWYRRTFVLPEGAEGKRILLECDGIYRNSQVFVNGFYMGLHESGYSPSAYDITDFLNYKGKNSIAIRVDAGHGEGWFYEGAGIYRHVWLSMMGSVYIEPWETTVRPDGIGANTTLNLASIAGNRSTQDAVVSLFWEIFDAKGRLVAQAKSAARSISAGAKQEFTAIAVLANPMLWSPDTPSLYRAVVTLETPAGMSDQETTVFGVRSVEFTPDKGMFLNGKQVKLKGVCNHQDHAGVGVAIPDRLQEWRIEQLLGMGCNALRTSHNYPTPELVDICDRLGVMMMCETRTFSSSQAGQDELANMIRRYRNHPSIIIWSLGNEEFALQGADEGERIMVRNEQLAHHLDPTRKCTVAINGDWGGGMSKTSDVHGFNYHVDKIEAYRKDHPTQPEIGTETASLVSTRGIYQNDAKHNWVSSYDLNDKAKGVSWGETAEEWWKIYGTRDYLPGGFAWTGFDYRGEPTPYGWPSTSSQFGIMDLCGFPKDEYFYYKAWWGKEPVLHLFPHWNWNAPGQPIRVWVYSNLDAVELFVNGKSFGRKTVPTLGHLEWPEVPYFPGKVEACGIRNGKVVMIQSRETVGEPALLRLTADQEAINADGEGLSMIKLEVLDAQKHVHPLACVNVRFLIRGEGQIIGLGNGDPNSLEADRGPDHSTFNGLAQVIVQASRKPGTIQLEAASPGLQPAYVTIQTKSIDSRPSFD